MLHVPQLQDKGLRVVQALRSGAEDAHEEVAYCCHLVEVLGAVEELVRERGVGLGRLAARPRTRQRLRGELVAL